MLFNSINFVVFFINSSIGSGNYIWLQAKVKVTDIRTGATKLKEASEADFHGATTVRNCLHFCLFSHVKEDNYY